jgi:glycosyl transferase family 25
MRAYVVNLPASVDQVLHQRRRDHIESELRRTGISYTFVDSVDGLRLTPDDRAGLVDEEAVAQSPHWLTDGVVGASLSHVAAYRAILADGEPAGLVLEDDAVLPDDLGTLLDELAAELSGAEVVLLYWRSVREPVVFSTADSVQLSNGSMLRYPRDLATLGCASAYVLTAEACRRLIDVVLPIRSCTDTWVTFHGWGGFDSLRCVVPHAAGNRTDFKSTVNYHGESSLRASLSSFVAHRRVFPLHQIFGMVRAARERRGSRFKLSEERSPLAESASHQG